jgi:branched-chain amino acid transport system ATP-binding protein
MAPLLELESLSAGYGRTPVLAGVSLRLEPGQAWVVLGPNGAGKSTLVRAVMGLLAPTAGTVRVCGLPVPGTTASQLSKVAAWVPQTTDDETGFTGLELALMGCAPHLSAWGLPGARDEARALEVMKELGVAHLAARPLGEVSGGERRRVWLARALVQAPKLLVLDEPTAGMNQTETAEVLSQLLELKAEGQTILLVEHKLDLVLTVSDRVIVMDGGRIIAQGSPEHVRRDPAVVEAYLGRRRGLGGEPE